MMSRIGGGTIGDERRHHHRGERKIKGDAHMGRRHAENAGLGRGDEAAGDDRGPEHEIEGKPAVKRDETDDRQHERRTDHQHVVKGRLREDDRARGDRDPDIGQREPLDSGADPMRTFRESVS